MLIVPLHRRLTAGNFPYVTFLLIVVNVLVFLGWQVGDSQILERAAGYYEQVGLERYELPVYRTWLSQQARSAPAAMPDEGDYTPSQLALLSIQGDSEFLAALRADKIITPDDEAYAEWRPLRREFDRLWESSFTERYLLRFSELDITRMFTAMFLHGGLEHLLGNMLFLAFLGMLVEGALGSGLFLALYLLGGLGGQLFSLYWRWGESGSALGASGAIAALMGAYCVLWGMRKVRFFYWFFVVFDYVRAPALLLLPLWLGWQVLNLLFNTGAHVGFDAHAGGIASGALLALVVVKLHWQRLEFLDDEVVAENSDASFQRALAHLGKLEIAQAKSLLSPLVAVPSPPLPHLLAWYRCCRYQPVPTELAAAARHVLMFRTANAGDRVDVRRILDDCLSNGGELPLTDVEVVQLARQWLDFEALDDAERLLRTLADRPPTAGLPETWLQLLRKFRERNEHANSQRACSYILQNFADSDVARKAAFLQSADAS